MILLYWPKWVRGKSELSILPSKFHIIQTRVKQLSMRTESNRKVDPQRASDRATDQVGENPNVPQPSSHRSAVRVFQWLKEHIFRNVIVLFGRFVQIPKEIKSAFIVSDPADNSPSLSRHLIHARQRYSSQGFKAWEYFVSLGKFTFI